MTLCLPVKRALATNSTDTSFAAKIPKITEPTGAGVFDLTSTINGVGSAHEVPTWIEVIPFATTTDNATFEMRITGWSRVEASDLWIPQLLAHYSCTIGNVSGTAIAANTLMVDTIAITKGAADGSQWASLITTATDTPASVALHLRGCRYIEFGFDSTNAGAVSMNCFWRPFKW